ncbi:bacillithiol system redox-active protein YtxJ [Ekhidna sp.]
MLSGLFSKKESVSVPWIQLSDASQLDKVDEDSKERPIVIFKHSTRCSISAMSLSRFERSYNEDAPFETYYLDLIAYRNISDEITDRYEVRHESPQVLLISNGKSIFNTSHMGISFDELKSEASKV